MKDFSLNFHLDDFPASVRALNMQTTEDQLKDAVQSRMASDEVEIGTTATQVPIEIGAFEGHQLEARIGKIGEDRDPGTGQRTPVFKCYSVRKTEPEVEKKFSLFGRLLAGFSK